MEEKNRKPDRRVAKTKRAIRNAIADLMTQKSYNDITIKDVADLADINRKTFYNYYSGIYQVVEEIENEILAKLDLIIGEVDFNACIENPSVILHKITNVMNEDLDFYGHLFSMKEGFSFMQKVVSFLKSKTKETLLESFSYLNQSVLDIVLDYTFTGVIVIYQQWFNSDRKQSLEEISNIISNLAVNGFSSFIKQ